MRGRIPPAMGALRPSSRVAIVSMNARVEACSATNVRLGPTMTVFVFIQASYLNWKKVAGLLWKCQSCNKFGETFPIDISKFDEKIDSYFKVLKSESESLFIRTIESIGESLKPIKESLSLLQKSVAGIKSVAAKPVPSIPTQNSVKFEIGSNVPTSYQFRIDGIH